MLLKKISLHPHTISKLSKHLVAKLRNQIKILLNESYYKVDKTVSPKNSSNLLLGLDVKRHGGHGWDIDGGSTVGIYRDS